MGAGPIRKLLRAVKLMTTSSAVIGLATNYQLVAS